MKDQAINEAIARALPNLRGRDFVNNLNAMHEAIATSCFDREMQQKFLVHLKSNVGPHYEPHEQILFGVMIHSTAAQRAEAFLRTLNLWRDDTTERKETK